VTAGVYVVARSHILFTHSPTAMLVVAIVGCATAFFAATIGLVQTDIKRVLAYSTVSQLGYMFLACGIGAFTAGIFHLMTHAFFAALLTAFYMFRLIFLTFSGRPRYDEKKVHVHESTWSMLGPLVVLAILSVIGGWFALPAFFQRPDYFANFLGPVFGVREAVEASGEAAVHQLELTLAGVAVVAALIGWAVAYWLYVSNPRKADDLAKSMRPAYTTLLNKFYVDELYAAFVVRPLLWLS